MPWPRCWRGLGARGFLERLCRSYVRLDPGELQVSYPCMYYSTPCGKRVVSSTSRTEPSRPMRAKPYKLHRKLLIRHPFNLEVGEKLPGAAPGASNPVSEVVQVHKKATSRRQASAAPDCSGPFASKKPRSHSDGIENLEPTR